MELTSLYCVATQRHPFGEDGFSAVGFPTLAEWPGQELLAPPGNHTILLFRPTNYPLKSAVALSQPQKKQLSGATLGFSTFASRRQEGKLVWVKRPVENKEKWRDEDAAPADV